MNYRTHEEVMASNNQVEHKLDMMKFMGIGAGCLMAMPFATGLVATGLFAVGMYGIAKTAQKHFHVEQTYSAFMALHREKDIQSPVYQELSKIAKQFEKIEDMSFAQAQALGEKVKELTESKKFRTNEEFSVANKYEHHNNRVLKFAALGAGCLVAAPFTPVLATVALATAGTASLVLSLKHKLLKQHNGGLLTALTNQKDVSSPEYQKLASIEQEDNKVGLQNLSIGSIMDRVNNIREIIKGNDVIKVNKNRM